MERNISISAGLYFKENNNKDLVSVRRSFFEYLKNNSDSLDLLGFYDKSRFEYIIFNADISLSDNYVEINAEARTHNHSESFDFLSEILNCNIQLDLNITEYEVCFFGEE